MILAAAFLIISLAPWPDPFDAAFAQAVAPPAKGEDVSFRPEPSLDWVDAVRRMPEAAPGKQQYVQFLKEKYGYNIGTLNAAYGLEAGSFTELLSYDYRRLDRKRAAVQSDDEAFLKVLVTAALDAVRGKG